VVPRAGNLDFRIVTIGSGVFGFDKRVNRFAVNFDVRENAKHARQSDIAQNVAGNEFVPPFGSLII